MWILPGHASLLQKSTWWSCPGHVRPSCEGGGLSHALLRDRFPPPHESEHSDQPDHSPQLPWPAVCGNVKLFLYNSDLFWNHKW